MSDLAAFLRARLDEDEATATACQSPAPWHVSAHPAMSSVVDDAVGDPLIYNEGSPSPEEAAHIARHDPARALRQAGAMRKILDDLPAYGKQRRDLRDHMYLPENAAYHTGHADGTDDAARWALRHLAAVYSDHADYDPAWNPETAKPPRP